MAQPLKFNCTSCGQAINIPAPQESGIFRVICPHCGHVIKIKYTPKPIHMAPTPQQPPKPAPSMPQKDELLEKAKHAPTQRFGSLGEMVGDAAPYSKSLLASPAPKRGVKMPKLSMVRLGMDKQYFPLHEGDNLVGRKDPASPVDVELEGDETISRRSVNIRVEHQTGTVSYTLTVLKALNPVLVNNVAIAVGQTCSLRPGCSICLGQTILRLEE